MCWKSEWILCFKIEVLGNILKEFENRTGKCHPESTKDQGCSELFQRKSAVFSAVLEEFSAETTLFSADFATLKNWFFSVDQSWISAVQRFSGNVQRWIRTETALLSSESEVISAEIWDLNRGNFLLESRMRFYYQRRYSVTSEHIWA